MDDSKSAEARRDLLTGDDLISDRVLQSVDEDQLRHAPLARLVAELADLAETPLNIALYGSWGSGKSSFFALLKQDLDDRETNVAVVRYDAWKYSGEALQRDFLVDAAKQLGIEPPSLTEARQSKRLDPPDDVWKYWKRTVNWAWRVFTIPFVAGLLFYVVSAAIVSSLSKKTFADIISWLPAAFVAPASLLAVLAVATKLVLAEAITDVQESPPKEERLEAAFTALLKDARKRRICRRRPHRFMFFIDELDRCSTDEVVETLSAVRYFLDQPECIFIVAADRDVLEKALSSPSFKQQNPVNEESPYYSSASEFLDKVFQTQLALPPLRDQRRTLFARQLVLAKERGIWAELRQVDAGRLLDDVVFVLIPPHVRSPRRIKVLLNNFALNARAAEARGLDWLARAPEIAKLTVFETEFPLFAPDLHIEPRLPDLLLDGESGREPTTRLKRLLDRHRLAPTVSEPDEEGTDHLLVKEKRRELINAQREQLRRYLETRSGFPNPRPDLLYLEDVGSVVGISDPDLASVLETEAPEAPDDAIIALRGLDVAELRAAARLLASMIQQDSVRTERENVVTVLMHVVESLAVELGDSLREVADALKEYLRSGLELKEGHLVTAFQIALQAEQTGDKPLRESVFRDERMLDDSDRLRAVASLLPRLGAKETEAVFDRIGERFGDDPEVLTQPLEQLPEPNARELFGKTEETVWRVISELDEEAAVAIADKMYAAAEARGVEQNTIFGLVHSQALKHANTYISAREHQDRATAVYLGYEVATEHALLGLEHAESEDWDYWKKILDLDPSPASGQNTAIAALASIFSKFRTANADEQRLAEALVLRIVQTSEPFTVEALQNTTIEAVVENALGSQEWWTSLEAREEQERLHAIARVLCSESSAVSALIEPMLFSDIERCFESEFTPELIVGVGTLGAGLPSVAPDDLAQRVQSAADSYPSAVVRARLELARAAKRASREVGGDSILKVTRNEVRASIDSDGSTILDLWLALEPPSDEVLALAKELPYKTSVFGSFVAWAISIDIEERTTFLAGLIDETHDASGWIKGIQTAPLDEPRLVTKLAELVRRASRTQSREVPIRSLLALRPESAQAQRLAAGIVVHLLDLHKHGDFKTALRALPAIGTGHQSARRLKKALRSCCEATNRKVPSRSISVLANAGIDLPKKYLSE